MGHHPPIGGQPVPTGEAISVGESSALGWFWIIVGIIILVLIWYFVFRKKH